MFPPISLLHMVDKMGIDPLPIKKLHDNLPMSTHNFSPEDIPLGTAAKGRGKRAQKRRQKQRISKASRCRNRN